MSIWKTLEPWTEWTHGMFNDNLTCPVMEVFPPKNDDGILADCLLQRIIEVNYLPWLLDAMLACTFEM